ncbi:MAG: hypothetical protein ACSHWY_05620 [Octadecabacter sp.]
MNNVQPKYTPPRAIALTLGLVIFALYQVARRPDLLASSKLGDPAPLGLALLFSAIMGYGLTMLVWLMWRTYGQIWYTFRPTRGRVIGAFCLAMVAPIVVFSYVPWIIGPILFFSLASEPLHVLEWATYATLAAYPIAAMIVRHTYQRRLLRIGLFALCFWTAYSAHMLWAGVAIFRI